MKKHYYKELAVLGMIGMLAGGVGAAEAPKLIIPGDYADPSIVRDGADYYMTHSPFYYTPGFHDLAFDGPGSLGTGLPRHDAGGRVGDGAGSDQA